MTSTRGPLTERELDALDDLLAPGVARGVAMPLAALHGFLAGVACAPEPIAEERWLPVALGADLGKADAATREQATALLLALRHEIESGLLAEHGIEPILDEDDRRRPDFRQWARGFLKGAALAAPSWEAAGAEDAERLLLPFVLVGQREVPAPVLADHGIREEDVGRLTRASERQLAAHVQEAFDFWTRRRYRVATVRRTGAKVGRNDLCACGSGRKFKRCCGARASEG